MKTELKCSRSFRDLNLEKFRGGNPETLTSLTKRRVAINFHVKLLRACTTHRPHAASKMFLLHIQIAKRTAYIMGHLFDCLQTI